MAKKNHKPKCDCLFCSSKCPECGSDDIHVKFNVQYEYSNDSIDKISVSQMEDSIEIQCEDCGSDFDSEFDHDERLEPLRQALLTSLDLPVNIHFDIAEGKIKESHYITVSTPV